MNNLDSSATPRKLWLIFLMILTVLVGIEVLFIKPHPHFYIDGTPAFYAWYGAATCVAVLLIAKFLIGFVLTRQDTYYDE